VVLKAVLLPEQKELKYEYYCTLSTDVIIYNYSAGFNVIMT